MTAAQRAGLGIGGKAQGVQSTVGVTVREHKELGASAFSVDRWKGRARAWRFCASSRRAVGTSPRVTLTTYYLKVLTLLHFCSDPVIASCVVVSINKPLLISYT